MIVVKTLMDLEGKIVDNDEKLNIVNETKIIFEEERYIDESIKCLGKIIQTKL